MRRRRWNAKAIYKRQYIVGVLENDIWCFDEPDCMPHKTEVLSIA